MTTRSSLRLLTALALLAGPAACTLGTEGTAPSQANPGATGSGGDANATTSSGVGGQGGSSTTCTPGSTLACYSGLAGTEGKGVCKGGVKTCDADGGGFGACEGEVVPAAENCSNQIDDDCNGMVDDGCPCTPGEVEPCYSGAAGTEGVGLCVGGMHTCNPDGASWSECAGEILPAAEDCATAADEDCDGKAFDDADSGCACEPGTVAACDTGLLGVCSAGTKTCDATGTSYAPCAQSAQASFDDCVTPADEDCDGAAPSCTGTVSSAARDGGASDDGFFAVAVDAQGGVVVGGVSSTLFFGNGYDTNGNGSFALRKYDANGAPVWQQILPTSGAGVHVAVVRDVAIDAAGNVLAVGTLRGTIDFGGGSLSSAGGSLDVFVVKYSPNGAHLWSKIFGDGSDQFATSCAVDSNGNVYLTGNFAGALGSLSTNNADVFVMSLDSSGVSRWQRKAGDGNPDQIGWGIATTPDGNVVVAGQFSGKLDFGGQNLSSAGGADAFVSKLSQADGSRIWSKVFGDGSDQFAYGLAVDAQGRIALTGRFDGTIDFGAGAMTSAGASDAFVAGLASNGNGAWSVRLGDAGALQQGFGVATDPAGNVLMTGKFGGSADFGGGVLTSTSGYDVFVAKYQPNGTPLWSKAFGSPSPPTADQGGWDAAFDSKGNAYVVGDYQSSLTIGGQTLASAGGWDAFVAKLSP